MRIVFMGTPDFAVETLEKIIENGYDVVAVVTQPDKPKGRDKKLSPPPVKECALKHNLTVLQPQRARDEAFVQELKRYNPDAIVVVAFGQILPESILHMTKYGCINVHASLLPQYRGASPIQWAVIDGCKKTGVTTMLMDEGIDTGDILMIREYELAKKETGGSLFDKLSLLGAELLIETLKGIEADSIKPIKQDDEKSSYVKMLTKAMGHIDFTKNANEIERLIRGLNPWPSAFTYMNKKMLKIWDADVSEDIEVPQNSPVGTAFISKEKMYVICGSGFLELKEVQLEGKKRMCIEDFLRGNRIENGMVLG
ncbi:MAG: methionyl-tRNA formyltransferase [Lachnospira sp.]|jgi:methionyl-tRNA formyltransferase|nr:methionyl-tRNA formyltransferase [Lachnospira sp.]